MMTQRAFRVGVVCVLLLAAGCASVETKSLSASVTKVQPNSSLALVTHEKPTFAPLTSTKASLGLIGALAVSSEGKELEDKAGLVDPSIYIGEKLAEGLKAGHQVQITRRDHGIKLDSTAEIAKRYRDHDLVLYLFTTAWQYIYFPTDFNNYRVTLNMTAQLIDVKTTNVIASGQCIYVPEYADTNDAPTLEYLLDNNAAGLKAELRSNADYCVNLLKDKFR